VKNSGDTQARFLNEPGFFQQSAISTQPKKKYREGRKERPIKKTVAADLRRRTQMEIFIGNIGQQLKTRDRSYTPAGVSACGTKSYAQAGRLRSTTSEL
jgi:hypothetical protein